MDFLIMILIGGLAGWGAGLIMGSSLSVLWNIILGIAGGVIGGWLLGRKLEKVFNNAYLATGATALVGSCLILLIAKLLK